ncbi:hypothetical protein Pssp01_04940 [Pseudomonas sp. NBRC 100443]|nr:hypothetical protein Pssp01_04940 [Pseudomonas sp. NBRC 100443]
MAWVGRRRRNCPAPRRDAADNRERLCALRTCRLTLNYPTAPNGSLSRLRERAGERALSPPHNKLQRLPPHNSQPLRLPSPAPTKKRPAPSPLGKAGVRKEEPP